MNEKETPRFPTNGGRSEPNKRGLIQDSVMTKAMHFKSALIGSIEVGQEDLDLINKYSLSPLAADELFVFKIAMAGNEVDRDFEVFPRATLAKLANLFVGRTVLKDHVHRSDNQVARIYATQLVESGSLNLASTGEIYTDLVAKCYMVKTVANADLIAEIRAGIRKEVSIGCRIGKAICSVCGTDNVKTYCSHFGGRQYEDETCFFHLEDPQDAYEVSFVAIPAQSQAGTVKAYGSEPLYRQEVMSAKRLTVNRLNEETEDRLTVNQKETVADRLTVNQSGSEDDRLTVNRSDSDDNRLTINQSSSDENRLTVNQSEPEDNRLTVNQEDEVPFVAEQPATEDPAASPETTAETETQTPSAREEAAAEAAKQPDEVLAAVMETQAEQAAEAQAAAEAAKAAKEAAQAEAEAAAEEEERQREKAREAEARLRFFELAARLRKHQMNGGHHA